MKAIAKKYKDGSIGYTVRFKLHGKPIKKTYKSCNDEFVALQLAIKYRQELIDKERGLLDLTKIITVEYMFNSMLESLPADISEGHIFNLQKDKDRFIAYFGADTLIAEITPEMIESFRKYRKAQGVNNNTVNHSVASLSKAFNHIIVNKRLPLFNPCRAVKKLRVEPTPKRPITIEEWEKLKKFLPEHILKISQFMLQTGLRPQQVKNLLWERIRLNIENPYIEIFPTDKGNKGKKYYRIPISTALLELIKTMDIKERGYLFLNPRTNKPYNDLRTAWKSACKKAGIGQTEFDKLVLYNLKDTVGTTTASCGISAVAIQHLFNHSSIEISEKYISYCDADVRKAVETMRDFI